MVEADTNVELPNAAAPAVRYIVIQFPEVRLRTHTTTPEECMTDTTTSPVTIVPAATAIGGGNTSAACGAGTST